jgi:hypothetical protein
MIKNFNDCTGFQYGGDDFKSSITVRSLAFGADTPSKRMKFSLGLEINVAKR